MKVPTPEPKTRIRFTFDPVDYAEQSNQYIEGIYVVNSNTHEKMLNQIKYEGLQNCGDIIYPTTEGIFQIFTFSNLLALDGSQIYTNNTKQWNWDAETSEWVNNSEFSPSGNTVVKEEFKSAMIMLVLDCSSSLGSDFQSVKSTACQFIETLNGNTHQ